MKGNAHVMSASFATSGVGLFCIKGEQMTDNDKPFEDDDEQVGLTTTEGTIFDAQDEETPKDVTGDDTGDDTMDTCEDTGDTGDNQFQ